MLQKETDEILISCNHKKKVSAVAKHVAKQLIPK